MKPVKPCIKCGAAERYADGKCKPCRRAAAAKWAAANPKRARENVANWRIANPEKSRAANAAWDAANPEKMRASNAKWKAANLEKFRIYCQNYRARKVATGGTLSPGLADRLFRLQKGKCACGCKQPLGDDYHLDHRMPLALGGPNEDGNIQLLRAVCNKHKHAKHPVDFMQQRGFLL